MWKSTGGNMMDYTDRESVKDFVKENDIRDLA